MKEAYLSIHLHVSLPTYVSIYIPICLSINSPIDLFIHLYIIYLFTLFTNIKINI
jgi:hypothetical protein